MRKKIIHLANADYMQLLQDYREYISILGYSYNGQQIKESNVSEFLEWLETNGMQDITTVIPAHIKAHYEYLKNRPHHKQEGVLSLKTITNNMRSIRVFFTMLQESGRIIINPMSVLTFSCPKEKAKERTILTIEEIKQLYKVTETLQERTILNLAYGCGLRSMELVSLNIEDMRLNESFLIVQKGKGNKKRLVPMSRQVKEEIKKYIEVERPLYIKNEAAKALILNIKGERMRKYTCRKILKAIIARTKNKSITEKKISIHNLRHSIATHLLEQGVPIEQVRNFLGHSHLETTEIYTRVNQKQLKTLMNHE